MRHIPEEELHAYLDQALSRSQCVEIERHLSRCPSCQFERDTIAALRDRTTELLARVGPPPIVAPPFSQLQLRAASRQSETRRRWMTRSAWAASVAVAVFAGWGVNTTRHRVDAVVASHPETSSAAPAIAAAPSPPLPTTTTAIRQPTTLTNPRRHQLVRASTPAPEDSSFGFARAVETDPEPAYSAIQSEPLAFGSAPFDDTDIVAQPVGGDPGLRGLWRTFIPDDSNTSATGDIPLVPGLAVVQMRVQPGSTGNDVTAVDQLLDSGELVRTIAGPATQVADLVDADLASSGANAKSLSRLTVTIRQGDRMVAVSGPSQALGSLLARVNAKRRY
ncbi:MAG: zf-HC2 domain-containing protein [Gemmatimonadales bacterium]